ncbi:multidrug effflux MFS transporter [Defluviimonas sp. WL0075]|uniref:Bcr/CflA family efflux transporter n=1 Tax=Albidovulum sediminicola TaxID=2984331 RepID=A0ABT2Z241_9RHOB|nr:multidrug effflux MFS transporter [Defluviimonas sp. WL0075]MCV2865198.1 multidrug effflux MFS transporter [Defluviimonas sp. WL0075]
MSDRPTSRFLVRSTPPHISTLILIAGISALSMNIFLPSLPAMARTFDTDAHVMNLAIAGYLGVNAALQILIGPLADRIGRRPVILGGLIIFVLATVGCIYAPTVEAFLLCRMVQAVVAVCFAVSRAMIRDMVPPEEAASMIGYVTMGMAIVPMIGPAIGGELDRAFGWEASFWALAIAGLAITLLCWADLGETQTHRSAGIGKQMREYPELLASPRFWGYCMASALCSGAFFAYLGGAPFVGTEVFGLASDTLGYFIGAPAIGYAAGNFLSGRFSRPVGIDRMVLWGTLITTAGTALSLVLTYAGLTTQWTFFGLMTLVGLGNGMVIPNATSGMLSVRPHLAATASGLGGAMMLGGGALLSALAGAVLAPGTGAAPLQWIMALTSAAATLSALGVIARRHAIGR